MTRRGAWPLVLAACVVAAGTASILLGQDANWDLRNYHYYNAWALLNARWRLDVAPAQVQSFYNPLGDLPFFFLASSLPARAVAFVMAIPVAVSAYFLVRIAALLFAEREGTRAWVPIGAAIAIGVTGAAGVSTLGMTMNDWHSTALVIPAVYLALRGRHLGWAGFLMGCAAGLKLAYGPYAVGLVAAMMAYGTPRERLARATRVGLFVLLGWLATGGAWSAFLWSQYGDPVFPYFNGIFRSDEWLPQSFRDTRFGPKGALQWLAFPLYFSRGAYQLVAEVSFRDYRLAAVWVLGATALVWALVAGRRREAMTPPWKTLAVIAVVSYLAWLYFFSYYRYALPLEVLSGLFICGAVRFAFRDRPAAGVAVTVVLAALLIGSTRYLDLGRIPFGSRFFDVSIPATEDGAVVLLAGNHPMAYTAPFFRPGARFVSLQSNFLRLAQEGRMARKAEDTIGMHTGPLYILENAAGWPESPELLRYFGLARDGCEPVRSNIDYYYALRLCRLRRQAP